MSFNIGTTVRLREELCLGRTDRVARGVVIEKRTLAAGTEYMIWWDDGFPGEWFILDELEIATDQELSLPPLDCGA